MAVLEQPTWLRLEEETIGRMRPFVEAHRRRRIRGEKEVVSDFLFDYYGLRSRHLLAWTPGIGYTLSGPLATRFSQRQYFESVGHHDAGGYTVSPRSLTARRKRSITWIRTVLEQTQERAPFLGCFGLHEWAMLYRGGDVRHKQIPLRMSREEIDSVVEHHAIACTHFDAFRFFSLAAQPLNRRDLTRENTVLNEQPGCLHTNMDTLKWAIKLYPFAASNVITDAFELAYQIRKVDMRASPYDLRKEGLEPICIETDAGKAQYRAYQKAFSDAARPIRRRLIATAALLEEALLEEALPQEALPQEALPQEALPRKQVDTRDVPEHPVQQIAQHDV